MEGFACFFNFGTLLLRRLVARSFRGEGWCEFFSLFLCMFFSFLWPPLQFFLRLLLLAVRGGGRRERVCVVGSIYPTWRCRSLFLQCFSGFSSFGFQLHMLNHLLASHSAWGSVLVSFVFVTFLLVLRLGNSH